MPSVDTLDAISASLAAELTLTEDAPPGMIEYRRALVLSFWFKYYHLVCLQLRQEFPDMPDEIDPRFDSSAVIAMKVCFSSSAHHTH